MNAPNAQSYLVVGNRVGYYVAGVWKLYIIKSVEDTKSTTEYIRHVSCEGLHYELMNNVLGTGSYSGSNITTIFQNAVAGSGWSVVLEGSYTAPKDMDLTNPTILKETWDLDNSLAKVNEQAAKWQVDIAYTATVTSNTITGKTLHIYQSRGTTRSQQYTFSNAVESLKKTVDYSNLVNRLYGRGNSTGNGTYLNFGALTWTTPTNSVNKPQNQQYLEDTASQATYGLIKGVFDVGTDDMCVLIADTYRALKKYSQPQVTFEISLVDLYRLSTDTNFIAQLGDTLTVYDTDLSINVSVRIMEIEYGINDATQTKFTLGNYKDLWDVDSLNNLSDAVASKANQSDMDDAFTQITANADAITLKASQSSLDTTNNNVAAAQSTAAAAAQAASNAQNTANAAKTYVDNLASDSVITPDEKIKLKQQWDLIVAEATATTGKIPAQAIQFGVSHTTFDNAYSALNTYLNTTLSLFSIMTKETTGIVRITWDTKFKDYYNARTDILNAIAYKAKVLADAAQSSADSASNAVTTLSGTVTTQAGQISLKADKTVTDDLTSRISAAEIALDPDNIKLSVGQTGAVNMLMNSSFRKTPPVTSRWGSPSAFGLQVQPNDNSYMLIAQGTLTSFGYSTEGNLNLVSPTWYTLEFDAWGTNVTSLSYIYILSAQWGNYYLGSVGGSFSITGIPKTCSFSFQPIHTYTDAQILIAANVSPASTSNVIRLRKIALYEGKNVNDVWMPNNNELSNSSVTITDDSVAIDTENFDLTLRDADGDSVLEMSATNQGFNNIVTNDITITGNVYTDADGNIDVFQPSKTLNVGKTRTPDGDTEFTSFATAIASIGKRLKDASIVINVDAGTYNEMLTVQGFVGNGSLTIYLTGGTSATNSTKTIFTQPMYINGNIVYVNVLATTVQGNSTYQPIVQNASGASGGYAFDAVRNSGVVVVQGINFKATGSSDSVVCSLNTQVNFRYCTMDNSTRYNSTFSYGSYYVYNCKGSIPSGSSTTIGMYLNEGSTMIRRGAVPNGNTVLTNAAGSYSDVGTIGPYYLSRTR